MSVIITLWIKGEPSKLEEYASSNEDKMRSIAENAKRHGLIAHRFYGTEDGQIMVIDEWPDRQSFETFFAESEADIRPMMEASGVAGAPGVNCWRKLDTHDEVGWES